MAIVKVEHWVFRAPVAEPVANAFGAMSNRPALFLRISASDGTWGWGEVFCNFPQVGAEHRARLISSIFAPLLAGFADDSPSAVRAMLEARTRRMAIQCGEPGPFAQIVGAVDQALWDMAARRAGMPLWKLLAGQEGVGGQGKDGRNRRGTQCLDDLVHVVLRGVETGRHRARMPAEGASSAFRRMTGDLMIGSVRPHELR